METVTLRRFRKGDEFAVSDVICTTLAISNRKDYSPAFIEESIRRHSPKVIAERAKDAHFLCGNGWGTHHRLRRNYRLLGQY